MQSFDVRTSVVFLLIAFAALATTGFVTKDMSYVHTAFTLLTVATALAIGCVGRKE